jgi:hypothetical protein
MREKKNEKLFRSEWIIKCICLCLLQLFSYASAYSLSIRHCVRIHLYLIINA